MGLEIAGWGVWGHGMGERRREGRSGRSGGKGRLRGELCLRILFWDIEIWLNVLAIFSYGIRLCFGLSSFNCDLCFVCSGVRLI